MWKNFLDNYEVNEYGVVRNIKTGKYLKKQISYKGYLTVPLTIDGKTRTMYVHRIVAELFCEKKQSDEPLEVNHKDEVTTNCMASNLEWVTHKENLIYSLKRKIIEVTRKDKNGKIKIYSSFEEALKNNKRCNENDLLYACIYPSYKNYMGYEWSSESWRKEDKRVEENYSKLGDLYDKYDIIYPNDITGQWYRENYGCKTYKEMREIKKTLPKEIKDKIPMSYGERKWRKEREEIKLRYEERKRKQQQSNDT